MGGRLGTRADILLSESVLDRAIDIMQSMLLDTDKAGIRLSGEVIQDSNGDYTKLTGIDSGVCVGICIASSEGGTDIMDEDIGMFRSFLEKGILMKVDVFANQFQFYKVDKGLRIATALFVE